MRLGRWVAGVAFAGLLPLPLACSENVGPGGPTDGTGGAPDVSGTGGGGADVAATGGGPVGNAGGRPPLQVDSGTGGEPAEERVRDGGTVMLTDEDVSKIQNSECTGVSAAAERVPAVLQLVVDVSASMGDPAPGAPAGTNKWDITSAALLEAVAALPPEMAVGMQLFPTEGASLGFPGGGIPTTPGTPGTPTDPEPFDPLNPSPQEAGGACVDARGQTPIDFLGMSGSAHRSAIEAAIAATDLPLGTPTHDAYRFALDASLRQTTVIGKKSMLLITDGAPTQELGCGELLNEGSPTQPIIDDVIAAAAEGIRTYVIGSPGSEENGQTGEDMREWLSVAAMEGGSAPEGCTAAGPDFCHFDMSQATDFASALAEGLAEISENVTDLCTFEMPEPPEGETSSLDLTSVIVQWSTGGAELVQYDDVGECTEGWVVNAEGKIALCPATCERVELDAAASATVSMGCDPDEIVVH